MKMIAVALPGAVALSTSLLIASTAPVEAAAVYKILYAFCSASGCTDGAEPAGPLLADSAGDLFGTTTGGGDAQSGVVFELIPNAGKTHYSYQRLYSFCSLPNCSDGYYPASGLIADNAGNLYGTTSADGVNDAGTIFELLHGAHGWKFKLLYRFCPTGTCTDGDDPASATLAYQGQASGAPYDGVSPLYGTTESGGAANGGIVYQLTHRGGKWKAPKTLYSFCGAQNCADGSSPISGVLVADSGRLIGTTYMGGSADWGTLFRLTLRRNKTVEKVLHNFCSAGLPCADGVEPGALPILDASGYLHGTAEEGGAYGKGVIFRMRPNGSHYRVRYSFCARNACRRGEIPASGLVQGPSGQLFGAVQDGGARDKGGLIYELSGSHLTPLYTFCEADTACPDGDAPEATPIVDAAGNLYGTAIFNGPNDGGVVYELTP